MDLIAREVRQALRQLARNPGFASVALVTLALGIGANSAIFSVVNSLLLRPLPYAEPDRLLEINHFYPSLGGLEASISAAGFRDYRQQLASFENVSAQTGWAPNLTGDGEPERLTGARVSSNFFATLGASAALGRTFLLEEEDPGRDRVVVLSDGLWRRRFGADRTILGRTLALNGEPYEVVGVLPRDFRPFFNRNAEIFTPLALTETNFAQSYTNEYLTATARLAPGATLEAARGEVGRFAERLKQDMPDQFPANWTLMLTTLNERARGQIRPILLVLLGAVGLVLLIACVNVANLLLARAASRARDIAVRLALGAERRHLVRHLLIESLVLSSIGGLLGLALAIGAVELLARINPGNIPRLEQVAVDGTVLLFTAALAIATGIVFGLAPALQSARTDVEGTLREGGRGAVADRSGAALRRILVVSEFALALTLLIGTGLLIKSFARLTAVDPGFDARGLITFQLALPGSKYASDTARVQFFDELLDEMAATPGVEAVGATSVLPFGGGWSTGSFQVEGYQPADGEPNPWGDIRIVTPDFARAMGIPLRRGRFLTRQDGMDAPRVVVVDEAMVRRYWPADDPIGKRISFDGEDWFEVVGVVGHAAHEGLDADPRVQLYFPQRRFGNGFMSVVVRGQGDPRALVPSIREAVRAVDRDQPIAQVATMEELMGESVGPRRLAVVLLGVFAGVALVLASTGVYGIMSYTVARRTQELGVRMVMGADRADVLGLVMRQGLTLAGVGVVLGIGGALVLTRLIAGQLYQVRPTDPLTFATVTLILFGVATLATLVPAFRATRTDPVLALRQE